MEHTEENKVDDGQEGSEDLFLIAGSSSSEDGGGMERHHMSCKQATRLSRESSPPLLLAFPFCSGDAELDSSSSVEEDQDEDQPIEEWMILDGEEQLEDSGIQLNLSYRNSSGEDFGDEDVKDETMKSVKETWAVSVKDKCGADRSLTSRYFTPGGSLICRICNRMGHLAKSCTLRKKIPTCVLCGIQGHIQRKCPSRPCPRCGLPSHGLKPCEMPPVWNQHCLRCGMTGHLSDACPDTWRQYHLTIRLEAPLRPQTVHNFKHKKCHVHCYNCSKRGHYGYECTRRRMVTGTFPSLPYVCHYDTKEDILPLRRLEERAKEPAYGFSDLSEKPGASGEENRSVQGWTKTKEELHSRAGTRKTRSERRKERHEVKRLRREAQARREGGLLMKSHCTSDDEAYPGDPFRQPADGHKQSTSPPRKKRRDETGGRKSRKSREAERWKKRGGLKRGYLHPHDDIDIRSVNLLSPKQRVRHRKR
ncbi:zinc finger CCHC domain-containing protein 7-like isoform X2 [Archocentrus centrarchus]|uniref:zinc finger CCHC domain-containing protein 7-like isoform X2 n=1 Tax=Archocentrus centrarchus TaxID=63155 RepID=UPI0011EA4C59|nr:zinc finger CCHC domain-containing protein 7-like isoform X2 [Archocentrus centrarchus]